MLPPRWRRPALLGALALLLLASAILYLAGVGPTRLALVLGIGGGALLLIAIPVYLVPELERRFQRRLPERLPRVRDGVLLFRDGPAIETLAGEIERARLDPVILETDEAVGRKLAAAGRHVVLASSGPGLLYGLDLTSVRAIVANGGDDENAAMTIAARQAGFEGEILAIAKEAQHRKALTMAGANRVFAPAQVLAAALAARASERISARIIGAQALGRKLVVGEVKIAARSALTGETLRSGDVGRRTGVSVIGQWRNGELQVPVDPDSVLDPDLILIVAGSNESVSRFREICAPGLAQLGRPFVVAGCGEVGTTAAQLLRAAGEPIVTIDVRGGHGIEVEGDVNDPRVLDSSGLRDARAAILAVGGDSAAMLAALSIRDHAPDVPLLARVDHVESVDLIRRAGADFALSVSQVAAQLLAGRLLGSEAILVHPALKVQKVPSSSLVGRHPAELGIRERTGASVVAIERGDEVIVGLEPAFTFFEGDAVYVCGSAGAIDQFVRTFPPRPSPPAPRPVATGESATV